MQNKLGFIFIFEREYLRSTASKIGIISESSKYFSQKVHTGSDPMCTSTFFIHIDRCTVGKGNAVGSIEGLQVNPAVTKSQPDFHKRLQQQTVPERRQRRWRQLVHPCLFAPAAYLPYKVISSLWSEPRLQHATDTESLILTSEEAPRALQLSPKLHEVLSYPEKR